MEIMNTKIAERQDYQSVVDKHNLLMVDRWRDLACSMWQKSFARAWHKINKYSENISIGAWQSYSVESMVEEDRFWTMLSCGVFPVCKYVRHMDNFTKSLTPDLPDFLHDRVHLLMLSNQNYSQIIGMFGKIGTSGNKKVNDKLKKLFWRTIEFGLIKEDGQFKGFGAGLLSNPYELEKSCLSEDVQRVRLTKDNFCEEDADASEVRHKYYYINDVSEIVTILKELHKSI